MTTGRIRVGGVTHERFAFWGKDDEGQIRARTTCGVFYTYYPSDASARILLAVPAGSRDVDCMSCLVAEFRR